MRGALSIVCMSIAVFVWPNAASARCVPLPFQVQAAHSPVVVRGRPVATRREVAVGDPPVGFTVTILAVERVWKGQVPSTVHLYQPIDHDFLDMTKYIGVDFVVFGEALTSDERKRFFPSEGIVALSISPCTSKSVREGNVGALGPSRPPTDVRSAPAGVSDLPDLPSGRLKR
jgi:hypothetical protein